MGLSFDPVTWPDDAEAVIELLIASEWPYHASPRLDRDDAAQVQVVGDDVAAFWIRDDGETVGLLRTFDLDDVVDGSPRFDVRIAEAHRGRGVGVAAVAWLTDHLFGTYPELHRIEATTRDDNAAMQAVLRRCGYRLEGRMVEAWRNSDGSRADALSYAILRRERRGQPESGTAGNEGCDDSASPG